MCAVLDTINQITRAECYQKKMAGVAVCRVQAPTLLNIHPMALTSIFLKL